MMAAAQVGIKRSYHQMHAPGMEPISQSAPGSREPSPLRRQSLEAKETPGLRSGYQTPSTDWTAIPRQASFPPNASLVLIGVRGVGKSSLGVLAATAYNKRLVESERAFSDATGVTTQTYRKIHGAADYHKRHQELFKQTLQAHTEGSVIICSFSDLEHHGSVLLREYAQTHPVIHIIRDAEGIQSHLQVWSLERTKQLLRASGPLLRSCTNFEFFNLSERLVDSTAQVVQDLAKASNGAYLTLKRVERDFLQVLRNIIGDADRMPSQHSPYPLSSVPIPERSFTLCAVATVEDIVNDRTDIDRLQIGVDAVEIQIQFDDLSSDTDKSFNEDQLLRISQALAIVRRGTIIPTILTTVQQARHVTTAKALVVLTSHCFRLAPEYCTVDCALGDQQLAIIIAGKARTQVIGHIQMGRKPVDGWSGKECIAAYQRADQLGCDIVKITMPAASVVDSFDIQALRKTIERLPGKAELIAYHTGRNGRWSMCFNKVLTPVRYWAQAAPRGCEVDNDVLLTPKDIFTSLFAAFVYEPMHFLIYGASVSFSLSPAMHNAAYAACGMAHTFGHHSSTTLDDFERLSKSHDFGGAAVVQPYKTGVIPLLNAMSSHAVAIGSVNTIMPVRQLNADGSIPDEKTLLTFCNRSGPVKALYGYNTDWIGIRACLRHGSSPANNVRPHTTAVVCGAGGQARSTIYSLLSLGVRNIFVCNRSLENAKVLADHYNRLIQSNKIIELDPAVAALTRVMTLDSFESAWPKEFRYPSMVVSSIPTQTADGILVNFAIPDNWLKSPTGGVVVELAYRPMVTPIVEQMRARLNKGWIFMDGFDVLPEQAFAQFELFTGRRAPRRLMRDEVIKRYREEQRQQGTSTRNLDTNPPAS